MNVVQTVLIFAGIPAAIVAIFALAVFGRSDGRGQTRYRPGRPWTFPPVWYLPHPDGVAQSAPPGSRTAIEAPKHPIVGPEPVGGASGEW